MKVENLAWAVKMWYEDIDYFFLAGRYFFDPCPEPSHAGCKTALFMTRREAIEAASVVSFPVRVTRVRVTVEEI